MALFGVPLWGASPTVNAPLAGCDAANALADLWFRLGFLSPDDMNVDDRWVTVNEVYQFADDAAKFLARATSMFLTYDASVAVLAGTAGYALPTGHVFTESAWLLYAGTPPQLLRLTTVGQLFGLDAAWSVATGSPTRISLDALGVGSAVLYPVPVANATLAEVMEQLPADIVAGASSLPISPICQDALTYWLLSKARLKESDSRMEDIGAHCQARFDLYLQVFKHLWGSGA